MAGTNNIVITMTRCSVTRSTANANGGAFSINNSGTTSITILGSSTYTTLFDTSTSLANGGVLYYGASGLTFTLTITGKVTIKKSQAQ